MGLLDGPVEFHLSHMKVIHGNLMGVQHIPNCTKGEGGLLEPLAQLLKRPRLRRTVHTTMSTHSIDLKEVKSVIYKQETNQTPLPEHEGWENNSEDVPSCQDQFEHKKRKGKTL